jgi:hypothetical protein
MRTLLAALVALAFVGAPAFAADAKPEAKPVATNTACPTCDKKVDPAKDPTVTLKATDGKEVTLACCCNNCTAKAEKDAAKYADKAEKDAAAAKPAAK